MNRNSRMLLIFSVIVALAAATDSVCMARMQQANGWRMGPGWQQTSFSARGVVETITPAVLTMTVLLDGTSRLLSSYYGQSCTFTLSANTQVAVMVNGGMGYSSMMVNSNGGMMGSGNTGPMGNNVVGKLTLADVQVKDNIQLMGYQDTNGNFVVTWILVWLY